MNIHSLRFPDIPNQKLRFVIALGANLAVLSLCLLAGMNIPSFLLMPFARILLFMLDLWACTRLWQIVTLGVLHIAATFCMERQSEWLYKKRLIETAVTDPEGEGVMRIALIVGTTLATIAAIALITVFIYKKRKERKAL